MRRIYDNTCQPILSSRERCPICATAIQDVSYSWYLADFSQTFQYIPSDSYQADLRASGLALTLALGRYQLVAMLVTLCSWKSRLMGDDQVRDDDRSREDVEEDVEIVKARSRSWLARLRLSRLDIRVCFAVRCIVMLVKEVLGRQRIVVMTRDRLSSRREIAGVGELSWWQHALFMVPSKFWSMQPR